MSGGSQIVFDVFRIDPTNECLWRGHEVLPLTPKTFAVLRYLAEHPNQLVTKAALFQALWPKTVVGDAVLTVSIAEIRKALSDDPRTPRFIETVHRRGYRFLPAVTTQPVSSSRFQVSSSRPQPTPNPQSPTPSFVGREAELRQLHHWLEKALHGERQVVFVTGEAGIGKTTVVEAFLEEVAVQTELWIGRGQCIEQHGAGEAYLPVLDALGQVSRASGGQRFVALLGQHAPTWLVQMPTLLSASDLDALQRKTAGATQERMLREMAEALEALTADTPLVLWLEDLHWSDYATLDLLAFLARRRQPARLLVLGTYRPVEVIMREHPLRTIKHELQLHGQCAELPLGFLTEGAVKEYLTVRFPSNRFPDTLSRILHRRTDGSPLFMVNVVEDWLAYGMLKAREGQWELTVALEELGTGAPQNLRQMIEQQVARLTPAVQRMVEAASVAGEEFSAATVAAGTEEAVVGVEEQCEELVLRDYLLQARGTEEWPDGTVATRYGFVHALYREVAYEKIPAARRAQCHQRIGERLEAGYGTSTGEVAAQLALHFERARDYPRAIRYLQQAAENAARRSAHREGIAHLTKALVLLKTFPDEPGRTRQELSLLTALSVSLMVTRGYADSEVGKVFAQARKLCQEIGEAPQLFPVLWGLCAFYAVRAESRAAWETAGGLLRLAQSVHDPTLLIMANVARGGTSLWIGKFSAAREHLEQGIALYNAQHDRSPLAPGGYDPGIACFSYGALALWGIGYPDQALKRVHEALLLAEELGHPYTLAHTQAWAAALYQHYGEEQKAQAQAESVITLSAKWDFPLWLAMGIVLRGWALVEHGELEQGLAQIRQGIDAYRATGAGWGQSYYPALLAEAYGKAQQSEEGLKVLAETLPPQCHPEEHWWEAEKYRLKGELTLQSKASLGQVQGKSKTSQNKPKVPNPQAEAEECFQKAIDIARRQGAKSLELRAVMSLSRLWLKQGKKKHPQQMLAKVYNWFTEGFDTKDLQEAKALLTQLT